MIEAVARKRHGWLPILTVLFMISYGLLTMLVVEQGQTIESQRALIKELFKDSTELSAAKMKAHASAQAAQSSIPRNPSLQNPSTQAQAQQGPSTQADSQVRPHTPAAKAKSFRMPSRPASDLLDSARALITI